MTYNEYITTAGEMWDEISFKLFQTERAAGEIIELNPEYHEYPILPGGIRLRVPVEPECTATTIASTLPPWKRS